MTLADIFDNSGLTMHVQFFFLFAEVTGEPVGQVKYCTWIIDLL